MKGFGSNFAISNPPLNLTRADYRARRLAARLGGTPASTMPEYSSLSLPVEPTVQAPDGSEVRVLLALRGGSMAHFRLAAGAVSKAVTHRSVEELWFVVAGTGEMWRKQGEREEVVALMPGLCLSIPAGTHFQFRASLAEPVSAIAVTMPPWPGAEEAVFVAGPWQTTLD
jgi:mannose-6-phosphate isomerase-like protein (cupin superfamily)